MKPIMIKKDSLLYYFLSTYTVFSNFETYERWGELDTCNVIGCFGRSILAFIGAIILSVIAFHILIVEPIMYSVALFNFDGITPSNAAIIGMMLWVAAIVLVLITYLAKLHAEYKERKREEDYQNQIIKGIKKEPSVAAKLYDSWKNKFCVPVEIAGKAEEYEMEI